MKNNIILFVLCSLFIASTAISQTGKVTVKNNVIYRNAGEMFLGKYIGGTATSNTDNIYGSKSGAAFGSGTTIDSNVTMIANYYKPNTNDANPAKQNADINVYKVGLYPGWDLAGTQRIVCGQLSFGAFSLFAGVSPFTLTGTDKCGGTETITCGSNPGTATDWFWRYSATNNWTEGNFEVVAGSVKATQINPSKTGWYGVATIKGCDTSVPEVFEVTAVANCCPTVTWTNGRDLSVYAPDSFCTGKEVSIKATAPVYPEGTYNTVTWYRDNNNAGTANNPDTTLVIASATTSNSGTYRAVFYRNHNGSSCYDTSNALVVTINPVLDISGNTINATITPNALSLCNDDTASIQLNILSNNVTYSYQWGYSDKTDYSDITYGETPADSGKSYKITTSVLPNVANIGEISKKYFYVRVWAESTQTGCSTATPVTVSAIDTVYRVNCGTTPPNGKDTVTGGKDALGGGNVFVACSYENGRSQVEFNLLNTAALQAAHKGINTSGVEYFDGSSWTNIPGEISSVTTENITDTVRLTLSFDIAKASVAPYADTIHTFRAKFTREGSATMHYTDSARFYVSSAMTSAANVQLKPSDTTVCEGASVTLTASAEKGKAEYQDLIYTIRDTVNEVSNISTHTMTSSSAAPVKHYVADIIQTYVLNVGTTPHYCYDTTRSNTATVTADSLSVIGTVSYNSQTQMVKGITLCGNALPANEFAVSGNKGVPVWRLRRSNDNVAIDSSIAGALTYTPTGVGGPVNNIDSSYRVEIEMRSTHGVCPSLFDTFNITTVRPIEAANASVDNSAICSGGDVTVRGYDVNGESSFYSFAFDFWTDTTTFTSGSFGNNNYQTFGTPTTISSNAADSLRYGRFRLQYSASLKANSVNYGDVCSGDTSGWVSVRIYPAPAITNVQSSDDGRTLCEGSVITLKFNYTDADSIAVYCENTTSGNKDTSFVFSTGSGSYDLILEPESGTNRYYYQPFNSNVTGSCSSGAKTGGSIYIYVNDSVNAGDLNFSFGTFNGNYGEAYYGNAVTITGSGSNGNSAVLYSTSAKGNSPADLSVWDSVNTNKASFTSGNPYTFFNIATSFYNGDTTYYRARVSNGGICPDAYTDTIKLVLFQNNDIIVTFAGGSATTRFCEGTEVSLMLADGDNVIVDSIIDGTVNWFVSKDGGSSFTKLTQGTDLKGTDTLKLTSSDHSKGGEYIYYAEYDIKPSGTDVKTDSLVITIIDMPDGGNLYFALGGEVCEGLTPDTLKGTGIYGTVITGQRSYDTLSYWYQVELQNYDTNNLTHGIHTLDNRWDSGYYRILARTGTECPDKYSNTVRFKVDIPAVTGYITASPAAVLYGDSAKYELKGYNGTPSEWLTRTDNSLNPDLSSSNYTGNLTLSNLTNQKYVSAVISGTGVCPSDTTDEVYVDVYDTLIATVSPKTIELLSSMRYFNVDVNVNNAGLDYYNGKDFKDLLSEGVKYQWYSRSSGTVNELHNSGGLINGAASSALMLDSSLYHQNNDICFFARITSLSHPSYSVYSDTACVEFITDLSAGEIQKTITGDCWLENGSSTYFVRALGDSIYYTWELWENNNSVNISSSTTFSVTGDTITFTDNSLLKTADSLTVKIYDRNNKNNPLVRKTNVCVVPRAVVSLTETSPNSGVTAGDSVCSGTVVSLSADATRDQIPEIYGSDYTVMWLVHTSASANDYDTIRTSLLSGNTFFSANNNHLDIVTNSNQDSVYVRALYNFTTTGIVDYEESFIVRVAGPLSTIVTKGDSAYVGDNFTLRAYATGAGVNSNILYKWYYKTGSQDTFATYIATDTSYCKGVAADSLSGTWFVTANNGCGSDVSTTVNLAVLSDCSVAIDSVTYNGEKVLSGITLCSDALPLTAFTAHGIKGTPEWSLKRGSDGSTVEKQNAATYTPVISSPVFSPDTVFTVELSVKSDGQCASPVTITEAYNITVVRLLSAGSFSVSDTAICGGSNVTLSGSVLNGTGSYYRYAFDLVKDTSNVILMAYHTSNSVTYGIPHTVSAFAADTMRYARMRLDYSPSLHANGVQYSDVCGTDTTQWLSLKIFPVPSIVVSSSDNGATLCDGSAITLDINYTNADSIVIYNKSNVDTSLFVSPVGSGSTSMTLSPEPGLNQYHYAAFNRSVLARGLNCGGSSVSSDYVSVTVSDSVISGTLSFDFVSDLGTFTGDSAEAYYGDVIVLKGSSSNGASAVLERTTAGNTTPADMSSFDSVPTAPAYIVNGAYTFQNVASHAQNGDTSYYRVRVGGIGGVCPPVYTNTVKIVFSQRSDLSIALANQSNADDRFCEDSPVDFVLADGTSSSVSDVVAGSVNWETSTDSGATWSALTQGANKNGSDTLKMSSADHAVGGIYMYRAIYTINPLSKVDTTSALAVSMINRPVAGDLSFALGGVTCLGKGDTLRVSGLYGMVVTCGFSPDTNTFWWNMPLNRATMDTNNLMRGIRDLDSYSDTGFYRLSVATMGECPVEYTNTEHFYIDVPAVAGYIVADPSAVLYGDSAEYELHDYKGTPSEWLGSINNPVINDVSVPYAGNLTVTDLTHEWYVSAVVAGSGLCGNDTTGQVFVEIYDTLKADVPDEVELLSIKKSFSIPVTVGNAGLTYYDNSPLKDLYVEGVTYQWYVRTDAGGVEKIDSSHAAYNYMSPVLLVDSSMYHANPDLRFFCRITSVSHPSYSVYSDTARVVYIKPPYADEIEKTISGDCWLIGTSSTYFIRAVGDSISYVWELWENGSVVQNTNAVFSAEKDSITFPNNTVLETADSLTVKVYTALNPIYPIVRKTDVCVIKPAVVSLYEVSPNYGKAVSDTVYSCGGSSTFVSMIADAEREGGKYQTYGTDYTVSFVVTSGTSGKLDTIKGSNFISGNNYFMVYGNNISITSLNERDSITVWANYNFNTTTGTILDYAERFDLRIIPCSDTVRIDTFYCITGQVYGLPDNTGVTIYYRITDSVGTSTYSTVTGSDSIYSICGLPRGSRVQVSAQNRDNFMVNEFYGNIIVNDTVFGVNFHYDSIPAGNYIATGIVYTGSTPAKDIEVYCNVGGSLRSYTTDSNGRYTITVPEKTSFSIHPSYRAGYRVEPAGGYSIVQITANSYDNDFRYYPPLVSDTLSTLCGTLDGLPYDMEKGHIVTAIVQGVVHYIATGTRGAYCFEGITAHSNVVVVAPDIPGYEHTPAIRIVEDMPAHDTVILPFVYTSLLKDSVTLCGTVSGLIDNSNVLITYFVDNVLDSLRTGSAGDYCIKVAKGDYVRIVPSYQEGYRLMPSMYFVRADSNQNIFNIEYSLISDGLFVSGTVLKDGVIFTNTLLHYTVTSATDTAEGVAMTDIHGKYYIHGLEKGCDIKITPDYVKLCTVLPLNQSVGNLQSDRILDTFRYTSYSNISYYSIQGELFNLSSEEQEGLNVLYYVDGVEGYELLLTDINGKYVLDSLCDTTHVRLIAPVVAGYSVVPSMYPDIKVGPSYQGANFTYTKIDTSSNIDTDTFYCVNGKVSGLPDNTGVTIHYRITDSTNTTVTSAVVTASDSTYSICGIPKGSRIRISAENKNGFMVHGFYDNILVDDTLYDKNFIYDSIPAGSYTVTGIVYVNDVPATGIEVYSNIGNSLRSYYTDTNGRYTIVVPERTTFSVHPAYITGYKVSPSTGYSIVQISENSDGNDFNYSPLSAYDTVSELCGSVSGLPDELRSNQTVTAIVHGVVYYRQTDAQGNYCFQGVPAHGTVVILPPDVAAYEHTPAVIMIEMPASDTTVMPFVYTSVLKDTLTLCGTVKGLPDNGNVLITYFLGNNVDTLRTDTSGKYCIEAVEGGYVRIIPSYQENYSFVPDMYFFRAVSGGNTYDIEYSLVDTNVSANISGIVIKDGSLFANAFLHCTVTLGGNTTEKVTMTDINGEYHINGVEKGSSVEIVPDYIKRHTVTPALWVENDLQANKVSDTFFYTSFDDPAYYYVSGELHGLSSAEQEGLNVVYSVNGAEGSSLLLTDIYGEYILDSLRYGDSITVTAPVVAGYSVYPSSYKDITVGPLSHSGANFLYTKTDTSIFYCVKGKVSGLPDNTGVTIHYRITDNTNTTVASAVVTSSDSTYSVCGIPYGSRIRISAENKDGFMVREFYDNIFVDNTLSGMDFTYGSIPAGSYTVTGIVYKDDVPATGIEVYSNIGNSLRSYWTDAYGKYTIVVPERTTFSVHPTYMDGYKVTPLGGYSIVQISENSDGNDFYYYPLSAQDTVSDLCGSVSGLPDELLKGQTVTGIVHGVVYYSSTDAQGKYCFQGVPAHGTVVILPPDIAAYEHTPAIITLEMPAYDTTVIPFVYTSVLKDTVTLCGTVSGLPDNGNVLITYFLGNDIDTLRTDAAGRYCIEALEGDYVRIVPSYQEGFRFVPNMYFFRAVSDSNIYDIEYISVDTNVSANISGIVIKDGYLFANAFLHYTVTLGGNTTEEVTMTDIRGEYHINGVEKGSNVEIIPDYIKRHTVTPALWVENDLQTTKVSDTFFYTSFDDTVYYYVSGKLYGLSSAEQEGLNIAYSVNGAEGSSLLLTDIDGKYILDSLRYGDSVTVIAPVVAGYSVNLPLRSVKIDQSYPYENFVYTKTNVLNIDTDTFYCVNGKVSGLPDNTGVVIHYRITDSTNTVVTSAVVTASDSTYSICGIPYGSRIRISAENKDGFMVRESYDNILVNDTLYNKNFTYDTIPAGFYAVTGIVYKDNVPTADMEVYSNIGNNLRSYWTDTQGRYTIVVPERTTFSVHPAYIDGYKVTPLGGYPIVQISGNSDGNDFYYSPLSAQDTVSDLCGSVSGLPDELRGNQTVTGIVHGVVYYSQTDAQGNYCFKGVSAHGTVVILPPDVAGYEHTPAVITLEMPAHDTTVLPFVYTSVLKDTLTICGTVSGLPDNSNVLITYFLGNNADTLRTDAAGGYCIEAAEGDYVRIIPSYQEGYRFVPNMYFFRAVSDGNNYDIEYISVDTDVSANISGIVIKDGDLFANAFLHYTVTSGNNTIEETAMTDIHGEYHISGIEKGSKVEIIPDYVKRHTVTPELWVENNLQESKVSDTFFYTSFDDTAYYEVSGELHGLSSAEQEGLNVVYSVNGAEGSNLLLTDIDGKYTLDSLRDGDFVTVTAPVVAGYRVSPPSHTRTVSPSHFDADFWYTRITDTAVLPDTARFESIVIGGEMQAITDTIHYILECNDLRNSVDVVITVSEYDTIYLDGGLTFTGELEYTYTVDMSVKALYRVDTITVESTIAGMAGQTVHTYIVIVEKRFRFYDIVTEYIEDHVFMVNNNPNTNDGYEFVSYKWYINDVFNGSDTNQTLLSGPRHEYKFSDNPDAQYRVELLTVEGTPLQTCSDVSGVTVYPNAIYPNPAPKSGEVYFTNTSSVEGYQTAVLYTMQGRKIWQKRAVEISKGFTTPNVSGAYILLLQGENGTVRYKVVVN